MQVLTFSVAVELQSKPILSSNIFELCFKMMANANLGPERKGKGVLERKSERKAGISEIPCSHIVIF